MTAIIRQTDLGYLTEGYRSLIDVTDILFLRREISLSLAEGIIHLAGFIIYP